MKSQTWTEIPITSTSPKAIEAFRKGRQLLENVRRVEAMDYMRKALKLDPNFALAHSYMGFIGGKKGKAHREKALELSSNVTEPERLLIRMHQLDKRGDYHEVRGLLRKIASIVPRDWRVHLWMGSRAYHDLKWDKTVSSLRRAIELNPKAGEPYNMLAYAFAYQGKFDEAIAAVKNYVALKPKEPNPQDSLGEILMLAGRLDEAEAAYRRSLQIFPRFWMAWVGLATIRSMRGDWEGGRAALRKAQAVAVRRQAKFEIDEMLALSFAAEGKADVALKSLEALDKKAVKAESSRRYGTPLAIAWHRIVSGSYKKALQMVALAASRANKAGLTQSKRLHLRFGRTLVRIHALLGLGQLSEADKELANLKAMAASKPDNRRFQSGLHLAKGLLADAKGNGNKAVRHLSLCDHTKDIYCTYRLVLAQLKFGDAAGAAVTKAKLRKSAHRSMLYVWLGSRLGIFNRK